MTSVFYLLIAGIGVVNSREISDNETRGPATLTVTRVPWPLDVPVTESMFVLIFKCHFFTLNRIPRLLFLSSPLSVVCKRQIIKRGGMALKSLRIL